MSDCGFEYAIQAEFGARIHACDAEIMARSADGAPLMVRHACGTGTACFLPLPLEKSLAATIDAPETVPAWRLYRQLRDRTWTSEKLSGPLIDLRET